MLDKWRPKRPILIVVDDAKNYLQNRPSSGNEKQATNPQDEDFPDLVSVLEILIRNADANKFKNPVRFLFLERGQKVAEQGKTTSQVKDLFHVQLMNENAKLRFWLYNKEKPLFLESLDNKALQDIAENVIEERWPKYCEPEQFLERLVKFDAKKRPLFAIILAYTLKTSEDEISMEKESILHDAIKDAFAHPMYSGLCCDDLYLLVLATMCGGLYGLPKLESEDAETLRKSLPNVWGDDEKRKKCLDWGFAKQFLAHGRVVFIVSPMEPDLLGEIFVLGGFKFICTALKVNPPDNILQHLALIAWYEAGERAPEKLLSFFSRCGQDFPNEQLKDIVIFLVESFKKISDDTLKHKFYLAWARLAANLVDHYCAAAKMENTQKIFEAMVDLGDHQGIARERAKASVNLINAYYTAGTPGDVEKAQKMREAMASNPHFKDYEDDINENP